MLLLAGAGGLLLCTLGLNLDDDDDADDDDVPYPPRFMLPD